MNVRRRRIRIVVLITLVVAALLQNQIRFAGRVVFRRLFDHRTVADRAAEYGPDVRARLDPHFRDAGIAYPPAQVALLGLKRERELQLYAADQRDELKWICSYPFVAASGTLGPKLVEGDGQVPEGLYGIESLNPNSRFHLSLRLNYPNEFDQRRGREEHRGDLGGDIMIHGRGGSIGCIALENDAAEELFVLAADVGIENVRVVISPVDFRSRDLPADFHPSPPWVAQLYDEIRRASRDFPKPQ